MSDLLTAKVAKFDSLNDRERKILDELISNPSVKIREVCDRLGDPEQTVRGALTSLYKKLDIPEMERDKRGFLIREYQEAYQERYLRVGETLSDNQDTPVITVKPQTKEEIPQLTNNAIFYWLLILTMLVIANLALAIGTLATR